MHKLLTCTGLEMDMQDCVINVNPHKGYTLNNGNDNYKVFINCNGNDNLFFKRYPISSAPSLLVIRNRVSYIYAAI